VKEEPLTGGIPDEVFFWVGLYIPSFVGGQGRRRAEARGRRESQTEEGTQGRGRCKTEGRGREPRGHDETEPRLRRERGQQEGFTRATQQTNPNGLGRGERGEAESGTTTDR